MNALSTPNFVDSEARTWSSPKVLVVEDQVPHQVIIERNLLRLGFQCEFASDGQLGVTAAKMHQYHLILMDYQMPVMDGIEATRLIRKHEDALGLRTPIIVHSSDYSPPLLEAFLRAGADGYLPKPMQRDELRHLIETYLPQQSLVHLQRYSSR